MNQKNTFILSHKLQSLVKLSKLVFIWLTTLAIFSFSPNDSGFMQTNELPVKNIMGPIGAYFSDLMFSIVGINVFLVPMLLLYWLFFEKCKNYLLEKKIYSLTIYYSVLSLVAFNILLVILSKNNFMFLDRTVGGIIGIEVFKLISSMLNDSGTYYLLASFLFVIISQLTGVKFPKKLFQLPKKAKLSIQHKPVIELTKKPVSENQIIVNDTNKDLTVKAVTSNAALPSKTNLSSDSDSKPKFTTSNLTEVAKLVETTLMDFGVTAKVENTIPGPVITRFELDLAAGVKVSKVTTLTKDLARELSVASVRIVEVIPGKSLMGIEIPNENREMVLLRQILESPGYLNSSSKLTMALGKGIAGEPVSVDLGKMPHLLVAGTTGSGKSVGINVMLLSLLYKSKPDDLRLILIDPKMLELAIYDEIPHLLTPVVTDMKDASGALNWCVIEMERRYTILASCGVRNLDSYNKKIEEANKSGKPIMDPTTPDGVEEALEKMPYIVVIIDEFADMMMAVGKKVEELIARIAQKARAAGIHMILATQRPSVDVITGLIKANVPARISFQVSSKIDSRTILDQMGAENLLGQGDMLYLTPGSGIPTRVHGAFVSDDEVHKVVKELKMMGPPNYVTALAKAGEISDLKPNTGDKELDAVYQQAVAIIMDSKKVSISYLQRRLRIGFNRAARLVEIMEDSGIVSKPNHQGVRELLIEE